MVATTYSSSRHLHVLSTLASQRSIQADKISGAPAFYIFNEIDTHLSKWHGAFLFFFFFPIDEFLSLSFFYRIYNGFKACTTFLVGWLIASYKGI